MPSKFDTQIQALRNRVVAAQQEGGWLSANDTEVLLALIDAAYHSDQTKREDAEMVVLSFEVAIEHGALDEEDEEVIEVDLIDDEDETPDSPPPYKEV